MITPAAGASCPAAGLDCTDRMHRFLLRRLAGTAILLAAVSPGLALDFFFSPDTATGNVGQTVLLTGRIGPSDPMRGFTVYMAYDTTVIDLFEPPVAGALIAGRQGLQFNYFDHVPIHPDRLEIGATVFSSDFWAGPGDLFQVRFQLRTCADAPIAPAGAPFFVDAGGGFPPVTFNPAAVLVCDRIPAPAANLTAYPLAPGSITLRWSPVTADVYGRPLFGIRQYVVYRQQIRPAELPPEMIAVISDTFLVDPQGAAGSQFLYRVVTQAAP